MQFLTLISILPCVLALPALQSRQGCTGDGVASCNPGDEGTWARCDNGVPVDMGQYGPGWTCDTLTAAYSSKKRDAIPSIISKRQGCEGDGVPQCSDDDKTWSRCVDGVITPMGQFGDGWSCDALNAAFAGQ